VRVLDHDWFPASLPENTVIGEGSWLHSSYAFLQYRSRQPVGLRVGRRSGVYVGTMFNLGPQAQMDVGDCTILGGVVVSSNGRVDIGSYALLSYEVILAGRDFAVPPGDDPPEDPPIVIGDDTWVGARAVVLGGASIGQGAIVGACSVVTGLVPPYAIVAGNPARVVGEAPPASRSEGGSSRSS
jgi:acetyltransferase-like isoleucine patch superfamily enzyme